jgi:diadenosine tetraphosphate (Ap4A) HIT family hydrolase
MTNCIFCHKPIEHILCENDLAKAFLDNFPVNEGHTLVVPKRHIATFFEATADELAAMNDLIFTVKAQLDEKYKPDGYNIGVNVGEAGGQTVFHLHMHVIPRYQGDVENPRGGVRRVKKPVMAYPLEETVGGKAYNKLVRDKIPEIIQSTGKTPVWRVADDEEMERYLREKLWEEVREFSGSGKVEELADILDVIKALGSRVDVSLEQIIELANQKTAERGSFNRKLILERVID